MKRTWGRIYIPDERDNDYTIQVKSSKKTKKMWRDNYWLGDQGVTSMCTGYGWAHWLASMPIGQWFNPEGIYRLAQTYDIWEGEAYEGTSVRGGAKALQLIGHLKEYNWTDSVQTLIDTVLEISPVVAGTNWYNTMSNPVNGLIKVKGKVAGGHAYLISGVDTKTELFRIRNSWGIEWGIKGHCFISFKDMERLIKEDGEICLGIEKRVNRKNL